MHVTDPRSTRSAVPIMFFFACIISFIMGVLTNNVTQIHLRPTLLTSPNGTTRRDILVAAPLPLPAMPSPVAEPAGLQLVRQSYENPWQFSVLRTGIDELQTSAKAVMERDGKLPRVVVSLTSLPRRFALRAYDTIRMLKGQSYPPDAIYIALPRRYRRSNESAVVPRWMRDDALITILRPDLDYGPATKLIPALDAELALGFGDTRVVTIDDDDEGSWNSDTLLSLFAYSLHFEHAALGLTGWNVTCMVSAAHCGRRDTNLPTRQFPERLYNFIRQADDYACHSLFDWLPDYYSNCMGAVRKNYVAFADVLEGFRGALYQPRFFDMQQLRQVGNTTQTPALFGLCDDVWISGCLSMAGVVRLVLNPAIHDDAPVRVHLVRLSQARDSAALFSDMPTPPDTRAAQPDVEPGLHDQADKFVKANHDAVRWLERHGAWTQGLWVRPAGFVYASERKRSVKDSGIGQDPRQDGVIQDEVG